MAPTTTPVDTAEAWRWLANLDDNTADLIIADPPYSTGGAFRGDRTGSSARTKYARNESAAADRTGTFTGDNRDQRGYLAWCALWLGEAHRTLVDGGAAAIFTDWRQLPTVTDAVQAAGLIWRGILTWHKPGGRPTPGLRLDAEYVVYATAGPTRTDHVVYLPSVWVEPAPRAEDRHHLTEKPLGLVARLTTLAPPDGLVLDPFAGSGTTALACARTGRHFAGCELDAAIAATANRRIADDARQLPLELGAGAGLPPELNPDELAALEAAP